MDKRFMSKIALVVAFVFTTLQVAVWAEPTAAEKKRGAQANKGQGKERKSDKPVKPPLGDMSVEDREAVKQALQAVWEAPEVMQARDEVQRATETFRRAIRKAVGQENPRVAALVEKLHGGGKSREWDKKRSGPDGRGRPLGRSGAGSVERGPGMASDGRGIGPAGFMAIPGDFSNEERKRLETARKKAMESEAFQKVQEDLRSLLKEGEALRKRRVEMFHQTRVAMTKAMIEADPEIKSLLERMEKRKKGPVKGR